MREKLLEQTELFFDAVIKEDYSAAVQQIHLYNATTDPDIDLSNAWIEKMENLQALGYIIESVDINYRGKDTCPRATVVVTVTDGNEKTTYRQTLEAEPECKGTSFTKLDISYNSYDDKMSAETSYAISSVIGRE